MKIYIGPYVNWVGPYQLADLLQYVGVSEDRCFKIGEWLADTWVNDLCVWIHNRKQRRVKIKLHDYDTWNVDCTLSIIILPLLKQLKHQKKGSAFVDNQDVPEHLRSDVHVLPSGDVDQHFHARWEWVIDELIWTFEHLQPDAQWEDVDALSDKQRTEIHERISRGLILFGKYYRDLWS